MISDNFLTRLSEAVSRARNYLSSTSNGGTLGYDPTDNRAAAYHEIASVLMREGLATSNQNYIEAARQLQEQAEITTYSGPNGVAAILGNLNAMLRNEHYNIPLDYFSWKIDDAIVRFFESVTTRGDLHNITQNSVMAVDGLVRDSFGLINYFPGNAMGFSYEAMLAPANSSVWSVALPGQYAALQGKSFGLETLAGKGAVDVAIAINWGNSWIRKDPEWFGWHCQSKCTAGKMRRAG